MNKVFLAIVYRLDAEEGDDYEFDEVYVFSSEEKALAFQESCRSSAKSSKAFTPQVSVDIEERGIDPNL